MIKNFRIHGRILLEGYIQVRARTLKSAVKWVKTPGRQLPAHIFTRSRYQGMCVTHYDEYGPIPNFKPTRKPAAKPTAKPNPARATPKKV